MVPGWGLPFALFVMMQQLLLRKRGNMINVVSITDYTGR